MRKLTLIMSITADGFIAKADGGLWDAFPWPNEMQRFATDFYRGVGTALYSRPTYEAIVPWWRNIAEGRYPTDVEITDSEVRYVVCPTGVEMTLRVDDGHSHPRSRASRAAAMRFVAPSFPIASDRSFRTVRHLATHDLLGIWSRVGSLLLVVLRESGARSRTSQVLTILPRQPQNREQNDPRRMVHRHGMAQPWAHRTAPASPWDSDLRPPNFVGLQLDGSGLMGGLTLGRPRRTRGSRSARARAQRIGL